VDQGPREKKTLFTSKWFWGLFLNYSRFHGIIASYIEKRILKVEVQRIPWKLDIQRPCGCPISRGLED